MEELSLALVNVTSESPLSIRDSSFTIVVELLLFEDEERQDRDPLRKLRPFDSFSFLHSLLFVVEKCVGRVLECFVLGSDFGELKCASSVIAARGAARPATLLCANIEEDEDEDEVDERDEDKEQEEIS